MKRSLSRPGAEVGVSEGNPGLGAEPGSAFHLAVGVAGAGTEVARGLGAGRLNGARDSFPPVEGRCWVPLAQSKALDPHYYFHSGWEEELAGTLLKLLYKC